MTADAVVARNPLIVLCAPEHAEVLESQFARYARDYDVEHYVRLLRETYSARLARALTPANFAAVFSDPDQFSLLPPSFESMRPILTTLSFRA